MPTRAESNIGAVGAALSGLTLRGAFSTPPRRPGDQSAGPCGTAPRQREAYDWVDVGGGLLTYDGTQHTLVFQGDACIDEYAAAYLIDLKLPPADLLTA